MKTKVSILKKVDKYEFYIKLSLLMLATLLFIYSFENHVSKGVPHSVSQPYVKSEGVDSRDIK